MRILLEGPDGAGKTTVARRLYEIFAADPSRAALLVSDPNHMVGTRCPERHADAVDGCVSLRDLLLHPVVLDDNATSRRREDDRPRALSAPLPPDVAALLFLAGEAYTARQVRRFEKQAYRDGRRPVVVFDRWSPSTIVYQAMVHTPEAREWSASWRLRTSFIATQYEQFVRLDMTHAFLLTATTDERIDRLFERTRAGRGADAYEAADRDRAYADFTERHRIYCGLSEQLAVWVPQYHRMITAGAFIPIDAAEPLDAVVDAILRRIRPESS